MNKLLPTICNLEEAIRFNRFFTTVITAGPRKEEVRFGHSRHFVSSFSDTLNPASPGSPSIKNVEEMLKFAREDHGNVLVHCHAGMSRSTATAWGIAIDRGFDPYHSYITLREPNVEIDRMFHPNDLMVEYLERIFDIRDLSEINDEHHFLGHFGRSHMMLA